MILFSKNSTVTARTDCFHRANVDKVTLKVRVNKWHIFSLTSTHENVHLSCLLPPCIADYLDKSCLWKKKSIMHIPDIVLRCLPSYLPLLLWLSCSSAPTMVSWLEAASRPPPPPYRHTHNLLSPLCLWFRSRGMLSVSLAPLPGD